MRSRHAWLSLNSIFDQSMPSRVYSSCSMRKMKSLKYSCRRSLAKLMQNCSKLFTLKFSNPKMSSTPMVVHTSLESVRLFMCSSSHANRRWYSSLPSASRRLMTASRPRFFTTMSPPILMRSMERPCARAGGGTPSRAAAVAREPLRSSCAFSAPPTCALPRCSTPESTRNINSCVSKEICRKRRACLKAFHSSISSTPGMDVQP
mmetsp:Transcript_43461/g.109709  ORF Transcript_43461/g.109709 Transcript_43461/m.109709 type:complete len:205 (+) Transcript_43461:1204-1818(+)